MSIYNKINAGFSLGSAEPITSGIEDVVYIFNQDDFVLTYDTLNPLIIKDITAVGTAKVYKFEGTNNSFNTMSKLAKTQVGPRYTEEIDFNIAGLSTDVKTQIMAMGYGLWPCARHCDQQPQGWRLGRGAIWRGKRPDSNRG
ncbi:hypothetical protein [Mucilaginibacter sp. UYNi724]